MPEIPLDILDKETWDILPGKIDVYQHPNQSHAILILLLRRNMVHIADRIVDNYLRNHRDYIMNLLNTKNQSRLQMNIKLAILEYIGYQTPIDAYIIMNKLNIKFNYTIFRCAIKADNFALVSLLIKKGYPFQIKKHNDEIYHILNDVLNMTIMSESIFLHLITNICHSKKENSPIRLSLYTYIRILKKGYYRVCKKIERMVDVNIWNGKELKIELEYLKNNMRHLYDYIVSRHFKHSL